MTQNETLIERLERRGIITTDPERRWECCGIGRDEDGFCTHREGHPIYVARIGEDESSLLENIRQIIDESVHTYTGEWISGTASEYIARDVYNLLSGKGLLPEVAW